MLPSALITHVLQMENLLIEQMENFMKKYLFLGLLLTLVTGSFIKTAQETDNITEERALTVKPHVQPASSLPRKLLKFTLKSIAKLGATAGIPYILAWIPTIAHEYGHAIPSIITRQPWHIFLGRNIFNVEEAINIMKEQNRSFGNCTFLGPNPYKACTYTLSNSNVFGIINGPICGTVASWYLLRYLPKMIRAYDVPQSLFMDVDYDQVREKISYDPLDNLLQMSGGFMMLLSILRSLEQNIQNMYPFQKNLDGYCVLQCLGISEETINNHPTALGVPLIITTVASSALLIMLINKIAHMRTKSVNWCINRIRKKSNIEATENKKQLQGLKEIIQLEDVYKNKTGIIQSTVLSS